MKSRHILLASVLLSNCFAVQGADFFVSPSGSSESPFLTWETAATNIQDAIDAASAGDTVWVTNGIYDMGGKVMAGDLTNRVALDKALTVVSINGPDATFIYGRSPMGPEAVRCAWLTNGAVLSGFTLYRGATRSAGDTGTLQNGGGIWCTSLNATVTNCIVTNCVAKVAGGGIYIGTIYNSIITANVANNSGGGTYSNTLDRCKIVNNVAGVSGGGVYGGIVKNSVLQGNGLVSNGGGAYASALTNCIVTDNYSMNQGGGVALCSVYNCIVWNNEAFGLSSSSNYSVGGGVINYSCTGPAVFGGTSNIAVDPLLIDGAHIAATSPCRGKGRSLYATGTDIDGEPWANPPSMGCDEVWDASLTGPLIPVIFPNGGEAVTNRLISLGGQISGRASRLDWSFGDGTGITNTSFQVSHAWTNEGTYSLQLTAYNADNPVGVTTNVLIHAGPLVRPVTTISATTNGNLTLEFLGQLSVFYFVEYATNLATTTTWRPFTAWRGSGTEQQVTDDSTNVVRYYRLRIQ